MSTAELILVLLIVLALVIIMPLAVIWSVNTLFGTAIAYTFKTWAASLILGGTVGGAKYNSAK